MTFSDNNAARDENTGSLNTSDKTLAAFELVHLLHVYCIKNLNCAAQPKRVPLIKHTVL